MSKHVIIYTRLDFEKVRTEQELIFDIRQMESRGDVVVASFTDDDGIVGKGRNAGWRKLQNCLDGVDQVTVRCAGDLPGRTVHDLLKFLGHLREHGVGLELWWEKISTDNGATAILDLTKVYRAAKLSQAIRRGQSRAAAAGRKIGRPPIPPQVRRRIVADLSAGAGVRLTARKYRVAPASVMTIKKSMAAESDQRVA